MLGFVAAVTSEVITHHSIWSQLVGKYVDMQLVEQPVGAAPLGFAMLVVLTTMATLAPKLLDGTDVSYDVKLCLPAAALPADWLAAQMKVWQDRDGQSLPLLL